MKPFAVRLAGAGAVSAGLCNSCFDGCVGGSSALWRGAGGASASTAEGQPASHLGVGLPTAAGGTGAGVEAIGSVVLGSAVLGSGAGLRAISCLADGGVLVALARGVLVALARGVLVALARGVLADLARGVADD